MTLRQMDLISFSGDATFGLLELDQSIEVFHAEDGGIGTVEFQDQQGIMDMSDLDMDRYTAGTAELVLMSIEFTDVDLLVDLGMDGLEDYPLRNSNIEDVVIYG